MAENTNTEREATYLCYAWGETDFPSAALVQGLDGVRAFLVEQWLGEEDAEHDDGTKALPDAMAHMQEEWEREGPAWKWSVEFEIGGVSVQRVDDVGQARASLSLPAAGQEPTFWVHRMKYTDRWVVCSKEFHDWVMLAPSKFPGDEVKALYAAPQPAVAAGWAEERETLRKALQFYADGHHFVMHEPTSWDTVSGEPVNFYEDEAGTATVEDGSIAKFVLAGESVNFDDDSDLPPAPSTEGESNG